LLPAIKTALAGSDYLPANGTVIFAPGVTNQTLAVAIIGDTLNKPNKTFLVTLYSPTYAVLARSQGVGTIINDDPLPSLSINDTNVVGATNAFFNVRLNVPSGQSVTVSGFTSNGTAIAGMDYGAISSQLVFILARRTKLLSSPFTAM